MRCLESIPWVLGSLLAVFAALAVGAASAAEVGASKPQSTPGKSRAPRKVLIGTSVKGFYGPYPGLEKRLSELRGLVEEIAAEAQRSHPGRGLDLVVIPENVVTTGRADTAEKRAVEFSGIVRETFVELARKHKTYLVVPLDLVEDTTPRTYTNAAILLDRAGKQVGVYRKVHPVSGLGTQTLEGGIAPGREFPVFQCDFGKLGIQICYDMVYDDGWAELARKGAEVVVWPSASPAMAQPASRARQNGYYIVSSTYRNNASIFEPTGIIGAQVLQPGTALVEEIDLSYAILPWSGELQQGKLFQDRFGSRAGFHYYEPEDLGIFWSNDPALPIDEMVRQLGLAEAAPDIERNRRMQDEARGGPAPGVLRSEK